MRTRLGLAVALAAVLGCSGGNVTLDVDVLSFLNDAGQSPDPGTDYAVLVPPTGVLVQDVEIVAPRSITLVDAIDDLTRVREGSLTYRLEAVNREGRADATFQVRFAATAEGLDDASAVASAIDLALWPDSTTVADGTIDLSETIVEAFANEVVWMAIEADLRVMPAQVIGDSLAGRFWLRALDVRIVAAEEFF